MDCQDIQELSSRFLDIDIDDKDSRVLLAHVAMCEACRSFLSTSLRVRSSLAARIQLDISESLDERVRNIPLRTRRTTKRKRPTFTSLWQNKLAIPLPAFALIALLALTTSVVSIWVLRHTEPVEKQAATKVVYIVGVPPVEVQGSYATTSHHKTLTEE